MKRVLFVITGLGLGGAENQVVKLAARLKQRGWEILVVSLTPPGSLAEELQAADIPVESLKMQSPLSLGPAMIRLARLVSRWKPRIVHAHMFHANLICRLVRLIAPVPVLICTAHSIYEASRKAKRPREVSWRELAYRFTDPLCDLTTQVSQAGLARYVAVKAVPAEKIRVMPNGIDTNLFCPRPEIRTALRQELGVDKHFVWLAVGRLEPQKDYPTLLQAFAHLREGNHVLLIAGEGRLRKELEDLAASLGIAERVRFLGPRRDIPALMNAADAFVLSSRWEGFGLVVAEAMACGLPVVATDSGGPREIVGCSGAGLLVPPGDPLALARAMEHFMNLPEAERHRLGQLGWKHVLNNYSLDSVAKRWEALYYQFLARSGGRPRRMAVRNRSK